MCRSSGRPSGFAPTGAPLDAPRPATLCGPSLRLGRRGQGHPTSAGQGLNGRDRDDQEARADGSQTPDLCADCPNADPGLSKPATTQRKVLPKAPACGAPSGRPWGSSTEGRPELLHVLKAPRV